MMFPFLLRSGGGKFVPCHHRLINQSCGPMPFEKIGKGLKISENRQLMAGLRCSVSIRRSLTSTLEASTHSNHKKAKVPAGIPVAQH